ncbi:hypothetical protein HDU93_000140 [Gonapodya sp. JEL0774]|nr:hypothetical protein HDU93_000140 [Gonapodya sp. JEL0774]
MPDSSALPDEIWTLIFMYLSPPVFSVMIPTVCKRWRRASASKLVLEVGVFLQFRGGLLFRGFGGRKDIELRKDCVYPSPKPITATDGSKRIAIGSISVSLSPYEGLKEIKSTARRLYLSQNPEFTPISRRLRCVISFIDLVGMSPRADMNFVYTFVRHARPWRLIDVSSRLSKLGEMPTEQSVASIQHVEVSFDASQDSVATAMHDAAKAFPNLRHFRVRTDSFETPPVFHTPLHLITSFAFPFTGTSSSGPTDSAFLLSVLNACSSGLPNLRHIGDFHVLDAVWSHLSGPGATPPQPLRGIYDGGLSISVVETHVNESPLSTASEESKLNLDLDSKTEIDRSLISNFAKTLAQLFPAASAVVVQLSVQQVDSQSGVSFTPFDQWSYFISTVPVSTMRFIVGPEYAPDVGMPWVHPLWRAEFLPKMVEAGRKVGKRVFAEIEEETI